MVAVRPTFHNPALLAKQAANIDRIQAGGRLTLNVVSSWWRDEALKYGIPFDEHDDRYARTSEWLDVLDGCWRDQHTILQRPFLQYHQQHPQPQAPPHPHLLAATHPQSPIFTRRRAAGGPASHAAAPPAPPPSTPAANPKPPKTSSPPNATPTSCTATTPAPSPPRSLT